MKNKIRSSIPHRLMMFLLIIWMVSMGSLVFADGDTRPATPAEKELNRTVLQTFVKAVPSGPEGWDKHGEDPQMDIKYVPDIKLPLRIEYYIAWQDTKTKNEADLKFQKELLKLASKPGVTDEEINELQKKMEPHDIEVRIEIFANVTSQGIYEKIAPAPSIAGGLVYRSQGGDRNGWKEGSTYVFLGKGWKMTSTSSSGTYIDFKPVKPLTKEAVVRNIVVRIQAEPARGQRIIDKMDWESLKKLIRD